MDIIKKIKPVRATYQSMSSASKVIAVVLLISLLNIMIPHQAPTARGHLAIPGLMFTVGDYQEYVSAIALNAQRQFKHEQTVAELYEQVRLAEKVRQYLITRNSPLAEYANILVQQNNWKKIIALSNAESTLCRKYIKATANCWGVGGSRLWTMGDNLGEGIITMNHFLNNYPLRSKVKYADMSFEQMNGLYKQPARDHWLYNNEVVYNDLSQLELSL